MSGPDLIRWALKRTPRGQRDSGAVLIVMLWEGHMAKNFGGLEELRVAPGW